MYVESLVNYEVNLLFLCTFCAICNEFNSVFVCVLQEYFSQRKDLKGVSTLTGWAIVQLKVDILCIH